MVPIHYLLVNYNRRTVYNYQTNGYDSYTGNWPRTLKVALTMAKPLSEQIPLTLVC